jgi:hypothetical protein
MKTTIKTVVPTLLVVVLAILFLPFRAFTDVRSSMSNAAHQFIETVGGLIAPGNLELRDPTQLAAESLTNGVLTAGTSWTQTADFALAANAATYTHSAGSGTFSQTSAAGAIPWASVGINGWFSYTYTVSAVTGAPVCTIPSTFALAAQMLGSTAGTYSVTFQAMATTVGDFKVSCTSGAAATITFDTLSLKMINGGSLTVRGQILLSGGEAAAPSLAFAADTDTGIWRDSSNTLNFTTGTTNIFSLRAGGVAFGGTVPIGWSSGDPTSVGRDTYLGRAAAATLQQGGADAAAPVNQTLQAQGVAAGTSDTSGATYTIASGNGRGNATGSSLIFQTPTAVVSGSGAQTMTTRLTLGATAVFSGQVSATSMLSTQFVHSYSGALTAATMTSEGINNVRTTTTSYAWTNAMLTAGGAATTWDVTVATLPAKTQLLDAMVVILTAQTAAGTLSVQCGDAATFINYVVAGDAKAAANTVYGDAVAERGTAIDVEHYYLPSYVATTTVTCRFISNAAMSTMTTSTGRVILTTRLLP